MREHRPWTYTVLYLSLNLLQKQVLSKGLWMREGREREKGKKEPAPDLRLTEDKGLVFPDYLFFFFKTDIRILIFFLKDIYFTFFFF